MPGTIRTPSRPTKRARAPYGGKTRLRPLPRKTQTLAVPRVLRSSGIGFPKMLTVRHSYAVTQSLSSSGGSIARLLYSCNGMFDPEVAIGGHQPMYFDQLTALYNHYTVQNAKISIKMVPNVNNSAAMVIGLYIEDDSVVSPPDVQSFMEQQNGHHVLVSDDSNNTHSLSRSWNVKDAFGGNGLDNDELQGSVAANPTETQNFALYMFPADLVSVSSALFTVHIDYTAVWRELKPIASS